MANLLTVARVGLIFLIVAVWGREGSASWPALDLLMVPLLAWAIFMDALDGWAARKWKEESDAGALFDIAGDRIVELTLWVFFATRRDTLGEPLVALWVPMALITRTVLTDFVRSVAFGQGRTPFGNASLQTTWWARQLTASRWSRGAYGIAKAVCFCGLGLLLASRGLPASGEAMRLLRIGVDALVLVTVGFSILRAIPVLWEGHRLLLPLTRVGPAAGATPRPSR
jgi:CDP-diacylglycerol---glycerol-3-phosphate 3-phosphatidyltransferase